MFFNLVCILPLLLIALFPISSAHSHSVLLYHNANPPYSYTVAGKPQGIFADIFSELETLTGEQFSYVTYSVIRGQVFFEQGKVDIEPGINPNWRAHSKVPGIYSIPYAYSEEVVIAKTAKQIKQPEQFYGAVVGIVRGYRYGEFEQHFGNNKIVIMEGRSEPDLLAMLEKGRIDYAIMGKTTAQYYFNLSTRYANFAVVYSIQKLPVSLRLQPHMMDLKNKLDAALQQLIADGTIAKIYLKNTGSKADLSAN